MIYAEWKINGVFDNGIFYSWNEFHEAMFDPDIEILVVRKMR